MVSGEVYTHSVQLNGIQFHEAFTKNGYRFLPHETLLLYLTFILVEITNPFILSLFAMG